MADEVTTPPAAVEQPQVEKTDPPIDDQRVPYERFQQANQKAKDAAERTKALEKEMAALRAQIDERETAGLPELERERKRAEQLEKRAAEAEKRAEDTERKATMMQRKSLVADAATDAGFKYPNIAANLDEIDLNSIETEDDAARAIKRAAKKYPDLLKGEETPLPGRVLENGRTPATKTGGIDLDAEAQIVADNLKSFLKSRGR